MRRGRNGCQIISNNSDEEWNRACIAQSNYEHHRRPRPPLAHLRGEVLTTRNYVEVVVRSKHVFHTPISMSTLHIYISMRPFLPSGSPLSNTFSTHFTKGIQRQRGKLLSQPELPVEWIAHKGSVTCMSYSPSGCYIVTGSYDRILWIWDAETCNAVCRPLEGHF